MDELYRENILEHFKDPRNNGKLKDADVSHKENNPVCGDEIEISLKFDRKNKNKISEINFQGRGCAVSQATASILTEEVKGKEIKQIRKIDSDDIIEMIGIPLSPTRLKCAMLSLDTLKNAIQIHEKYLKR